MKIPVSADRLRSVASRRLHLGGTADAGQLDPDEWAILRRVIDLIPQNASGAELGPVLETIETALRADQAKLIEAD